MWLKVYVCGSKMRNSASCCAENTWRAGAPVSPPQHQALGIRCNLAPFRFDYFEILFYDHTPLYLIAYSLSMRSFNSDMLCARSAALCDWNFIDLKQYVERWWNAVSNLTHPHLWCKYLNLLISRYRHLFSTTQCNHLMCTGCRNMSLRAQSFYGF